MRNFAILFLCIGPSPKFSENLERNLDPLFHNNPFLVVVTDDFNVKSSNWYYYNKSSSEGNATDTITKYQKYIIHQVIKNQYIWDSIQE